MHYLPRIVDKELATRVASTGAVVIDPKLVLDGEVPRLIDE